MTACKNSLALELDARMVDFLKIDLLLGLTFAGAAQKTRNAPRKLRNQENARKVFDTILRFRQRTSPGREDAQEISENLERLRTALKKLGEQV